MSVLQEAVASGCIPEVERILIDGDPEELRHELPGALTIALDAGFATISRRLVNDPNFTPGEQACPNLSKAISLGYVDIAEALIAKGSRLNLIAEDSRSPLRIALENEYFDLARFMITHGAEVSVRDSNGWTALIWASITGNRAAYDFLIEHGADIHICTNDGWNALAGAFFKQNHEIANDLRERGAKFGPKHESAALVSSFLGGYHDVLRHLLEGGANPNLAFHDGVPLLSLAIMRGDKEIVELLIEKGADVDAKSKDGSSPLTLAIRLRHYDIAELLAARVSTVNVPDARGNTPPASGGHPR